MSEPTEVGQRILALMKKKGLSHRKLADIVHRRAMTIHGWVHGAQPRDGDLERLARILGATPQYIRYGDKAPKAELNMPMVAEIIKGIEKYCEQKSLRLDAETRAELILLAYDLFSSAGRIDPRQLHKLIDLAA